MPALIGKKLGMTSLYSAEGKNLPCTLVEVGPCYITQFKTQETDGYEAVQIAWGERKEKNTPNSLMGHFKKAGVSPKSEIVEVSNFDGDYKLGDAITVDIFNENEFVDVVGTSKGKGFQGVVKRHGFGGVGQATHGQHNRMRAPGSIGGASYPARVFKGMRMAGRTGGERVKVQSLQILKVDAENNLLVVKGSIPGAKGSTVIIEK